MADLGAISELINAQNLRLDLDADTFVMAQDIVINIARVEDRNPTTDDSILYTPGKGDNWFTAALIATDPEISSLNMLTQTDANGDWTERNWRLIGTNRAGATVTFEATGVLREFRTFRRDRGGVKIDIFVRITGDSVVVS